MNKFYLTIFVTVLLLVSACSSNVALIESISNKPYLFKVSEQAPIETRDAIKAYQDITKSAEAGALQIFAEKRIADLTLDSAQESDVLKIQDAQSRYTKYLAKYPDRTGNDSIWYQLARVYSLIGDEGKTFSALSEIVKNYPVSQYYMESVFRLGEMSFEKNQFVIAQKWYQIVVNDGNRSPFFEQALHQYSWSVFKQKKYSSAITHALRLMNIKYQQGKLTVDGVSSTITLTDQNVSSDIIQLVVLGLSHIKSDVAIERFFLSASNKKFEALLYRKLAEFFYRKNRLLDAANSYLLYSKNNQTKYKAIEYHLAALDIYRKNNFEQLAIKNITVFIKRYDFNSEFWKKLNRWQRVDLKTILKQHISSLAKHYHSVARKTNLQKSFNLAEKWYRIYLTDFPNSDDSAYLNFLLAELLYDGKRFSKASVEYIKTAYEYPNHDQAADAAYSAVLCYEKLQQQLSKKNWNLIKVAAVNNALRYINQFKHDRRVVGVKLKTSESLFLLEDYFRAAALVSNILDSDKIDNQKQRTSLRIILGHSQFYLKRYAKAEQSYRIVLNQLNKNEINHAVIANRLAASLFKQAEQFRDEALFQKAAIYFNKASEQAITPDVKLKSLYDAATMFIKVHDWNRAAVILEDIRLGDLSHTEFKKSLIEKLALVYSKTGQGKKAAIELLALAKTGDKDYRQLMLWQAATMYQLANMDKSAMAIYRRYIQKFPYPLSKSMQARNIIANYYADNSNIKKTNYWLREIIKADKSGGRYRSVASNYLAAKATLQLAKPNQKKYYKVKLNIPLKSSLIKKKNLMKRSIKSYEKAISYKISDVYTQATYEIAEIYHELARSIMSSQRPASLDEQQLEEYNLLMEEQAFPFEEKAIEIHLANIERTQSGLYDDGIKNSFKALEKLHPLRYVKPEKVKAYVESIN